MTIGDGGTKGCATTGSGPKRQCLPGVAAHSLYPLRRHREFERGSLHRSVRKLSVPLGAISLAVRDLTVHGFRSTFTDWVREETTFPIEVRKLAIGHTCGDKVDEAYARGDLFKKRRQLADAWARYCTRPADVVVSFPGVRQSA